jgi:hypothetical protein
MAAHLGPLPVFIIDPGACQECGRDIEGVEPPPKLGVERPGDLQRFMGVVPSRAVPCGHEMTWEWSWRRR